MGHNLLTFSVTNKQRISAWAVIKSDILWWLTGAGVALALYLGVAAMLGDVRPDIDNVDISGQLYIWARYFYWALVVVAVLIARRSKGAWTWVLSAILIIAFVTFQRPTFAVVLLPNSILPAVTAMLGLLAIGRIVEYLVMRYSTKLKEPTLGVGALIVYMTVILIAVGFNSQFIYELFSP